MTPHQPNERQSIVNKIITLTEMVAEWPQLINREAAEHRLTEAGYAVVRDEIGRPGLSLADVKKWREAARRAELAAERRADAFAEHQAATRRWVAGREEAAWAANRRARAATAGGEGAAMAAGKQAGTRAAEEYERTVPRPVFDGRTGTPLAFVSEDEAGKPGSRVRAAERLVGLEESIR